MRRLSTLSVMAVVCGTLAAQQYTISTVAGTGSPVTSGDGGPAIAAGLLYPQGIALSEDGKLYFTQGSDHVVRMVDLQSGTISHVAGTGTLGFGGNGGPAVDAGLAAPYDLALDGDGNLYISESDAYRIRRINTATGIISTFAGTTSPGNNVEVPALAAQLNGPRGISFNAQGDLFIGLIGNECVRYIDADSAYLHAYAGTGASGSTGFSGDGGPALTAQLYAPYGVHVAPNGDLYIADLNNRRIRKVDATTGIITTVAGNGLINYDGDGIPATEAAIGRPRSVAVDANGNIYFTNEEQYRIRRVDAVTGLISTIAGIGSSGYGGDGGPATSASVHVSIGILVDGAGRIFFSDSYNHRIRMLTPVDDISVGEAPVPARIMAFPSPATDVLHVRSEARGTMQLIDAQGRLVLTDQLTTGSTSVSVAGVAPGLYTLRLHGAAPIKVVIQ